MTTAKNTLQLLLETNPKLTPMMEQYVNIKKNHWDDLLFYRMGDFYELFFDDAKKAANLLNITQTHRGHVGDHPIPMAGVPYHAAPNYINRLNQMGYKVVICEQMDVGAQGIVERKVTQITSAAFPFDVDLLQPNARSYICAGYYRNDKLAIAFLDFSTGEFFGQYPSDEESFCELIYKYSPREFLAPLGFWENHPSIWPELQKALKNQATLITLISSDYFSIGQGLQYIKKILPNLHHDPHFSKNSKKDLLLNTIGAICYYVHTTQPLENIVHIKQFKIESPKNQMQVSMATLSGLEIMPKSHDKNHYQQCLLGLFDDTKTPQGSRALRAMFENPTRDKKILDKRFEWIEYFCINTTLLKNIRNHLSQIKDLDRLNAKLCTKKIRPNDLFKITNSIEQMNIISELLVHIPEFLLTPKVIQKLTKLKNLIVHTLNPALDASIENGNLILENVSEQRDRLAQLKNNSDAQVRKLEQKYREKLHISNLKIKNNNIHGFFIEVSASHVNKVPKTFVRKQTLVNGERFTTPELDEFEKNVLNAKEKLSQVETNLYNELLTQLLNELTSLSELNTKVAMIDCMSTLAIKALELNLTRPILQDNENGRLFEIEKAFHPLVKKFSNIPFVEHNLKLDEDVYFGLISGPNMAGKTTVMREMAIIVFLTHIGSFVPASCAKLGLCDYLFSRLGAHDNILQGHSTFMVEMMETASILSHATKDSFIVLDEIGRGTSTFDGVSLAGAIMEHLTNITKSFTLFSTHYHELIPIAQKLPMAKNLTLAANVNQDTVEFLYQLIEQSTPQSYGIYVAKLAGIPQSILERAKELLKEYETSSTKQNINISKKPKKGEQLYLFGDNPAPTKKMTSQMNLCLELSKLDPMHLSPIQALEKLIYLQEKSQTFLQ